MVYHHQKFHQVLACLLAGVLILASGWTLRPFAKASTCDDVRFVFARGSGEALGDKSMTAWQESIMAALADSKLQYSFYELGSRAYGGTKYPAVAVSGGLAAIGNLLGAYVSGGESFAFGRSVEAGRTELRAYLAEQTSLCPSTKFVLGGYSQGAMLITGILDELDSEKVIYVTTFGDPKLYLPEGEGSRPAACQGKELSNYRIYVSDCHAYKGILGAYQPYQPEEFYNQLGTWCNAADIMCSSGFNINDHTAYVERGLYQHAAKTLRTRLKERWSEKFPAPSTSSEGANETGSSHDVAILIYASSNPEYSIYLEQYKTLARSLAHETYALGGRVALYSYSDTSLNASMTKRCDFDCDAAAFERALSAITPMSEVAVRLNPGFYTAYRAMQELEWQVGATKSLVMLTPVFASHENDRDNITIEDLAKLSLQIDPVNFYPIVVGDLSVSEAQGLANATGGAVFRLDQAAELEDTLFGRPSVTLALETYAGIVGDEFIFTATVESGKAEDYQFDWDLDADGKFELLDAGATLQHIYAKPVSGYLQVRATDAAGRSSTMSAKIDVTAQAPTLPIIQSAKAEPLSTTSYQISFASDAERVLLAINDAFYGYYPGGQQNFILSDLTADTVVQLIPQTAGIGRGESVSLTLAVGLPEGDSSSEESAGLPSIPGATTTPKSPLPQADSIVPKVPNTGAASLAVRAEMPVITIFATIDAQFWRTVIMFRN